MSVLYSISVYVYTLLIRVAAPFNKKAALWVSGRKDQFKRLEALLAEKPGDYFWVHCASLGEFEQGRPLIEALKEKYPDKKIFLSFFSPSGFEIRKKYELADIVAYLPPDTPSNAQRFVQLLRPAAAFFIKYEFWYNYLHTLKKKHVPAYLISGIFRNEQVFFRFYGTWFARGLSAFSHFFVQNDASVDLLKKLNYSNVTKAGDTRFDRVVRLTQAVREVPELSLFIRSEKIIVAGSTWLEDEKILAASKLFQLEYQLILAPHEIDESRLKQVEALFSDCIVQRFSSLQKGANSDAAVLLIDNIGMLSALYRRAQICYIGGGFGKGIHNILEAAAYGKPVLFGPNYSKFAEAVELVKEEGAFAVSDGKQLDSSLIRLQDAAVLSKTGTIAGEFVRTHAGATSLIMKELESQLLF